MACTWRANIWPNRIGLGDRKGTRRRANNGDGEGMTRRVPAYNNAPAALLHTVKSISRGNTCKIMELYNTKAKSGVSKLKVWGYLTL